MSLEYTPTGIWQELEYAETQNKAKTAAYEVLRKGYHTPAFEGHMPETDGDSEGDTTDQHADPENHAYEFASYVVPQLVAGNPEFRLQSRRTDPEDEAHDEVKALEYALNQWVQDTDFRTTMDEMALDPLFAFGVALVSPTRNKATYRQSLAQAEWPEVQRISPRNFLRDPAALSYEEARYLGHRYVMDVRDLKALAKSDPDAGWDEEAIAGIEGSAMSEEYRPRSATRGAPERGEVELFEVWFPNRVYRKGDEELESASEDAEAEEELTEKDGFHGTIYTLGIVRNGEDGLDAEGTTRWIRKPRAYYGHKSGPYAHCQMMRVPDDPWGLAPLVATQGQAQELNALTRAQGRDIRSYKKLVFVDDDSGEVGTALENFPHRTIVPLRGAGGKPVSGMIQPAEVGGPNQALQVAIELAHDRLRRNSGMGEAQTGNAPSDTTATASAIASQDSKTRLERIKEQWRRYLEDCAVKVAFYIGTSADVEIVIDTKAVQELGGPPVAGRYNGGALTPADFEHMQVTVDVISVERTSEERVQARLVQATGMLMEAIPMVMQLPAAAFWHELFDLLGNTLNVPDMGRLGDELVQGALAVLQGDIPSLATREPTPSPGVSAGPGRPSQQKPAGQAAQRPQPQQQQNRTPGLSNGVSQPTPLQGVGGQK